MVWASGQQLQGGKYVIKQILGQGGFGITYKAYHTMLDAFMVIKTPNENLRNYPEYPKFIKRFREEGQRLERKTFRKPASKYCSCQGFISRLFPAMSQIILT